jgi:hypothetical protein
VKLRKLIDEITEQGADIVIKRGDAGHVIVSIRINGVRYGVAAYKSYKKSLAAAWKYTKQCEWRWGRNP